ncbi:MAG: SDR family oxidoreductase [Candidatus Lokiarchaeota archaeon]|nr:SDR family oxidoreductase [Candidatus Lokiarchaeota archaeon]
MNIQRYIGKKILKGQSVIICGGSKGIGRETSKLFVQLGANVLIIAREIASLELIQRECESLKFSNEQSISILSCDCTDYKKLKPFLDDEITKNGTPDFLINCVGYAFPQYVEALTLQDCLNNYDVNYNGQLVPTLIILPYFIKAKKGHIVFISSLLGLLGIMGYVAYAPSKFALVGLAESLRNELRPYDISISILFPPDTDTPGFAEENKFKPKECEIISQHSKLLRPEIVAEVFVKGILKKKFMIFPGDTKLYWLIKRFFPRLIYWGIDRDLHKARRELRKI